MIPLIIVAIAHYHHKQSSSGRSVLSQLFIIWTDKGTIRTSKIRRVKCTKVNQPPAKKKKSTTQELQWVCAAARRYFKQRSGA